MSSPCRSEGGSARGRGGTAGSLAIFARRKTPFWLLLAALAGFSSGLAVGIVDGRAQSAQTAVTPATGFDVVVRNVRNASGQVRIGLWDRADVFTKGSYAVGKAAMPAAPGEVRFHFPDLPDGAYAAAVYHDENDNDEMDRTWIGLPDEGLGFSNNAEIRYSLSDPGPPYFKDAAVTINADNRVMVIDLDY